jgi:hypothetical protein
VVGGNKGGKKTVDKQVSNQPSTTTARNKHPNTYVNVIGHDAMISTMILKFKFRLLIIVEDKRRLPPFYDGDDNWTQLLSPKFFRAIL